MTEIPISGTALPSSQIAIGTHRIALGGFNGLDLIPPSPLHRSNNALIINKKQYSIKKMQGEIA